ncbi:hypothetical protein IGI04_040433 [Brassica rapa subsp. trilocularis]|uniref:DUF4216 domain-containing protein n=1 Tax=Brassica rapa subsp. trilocularis TaxID=1813537 RepID=A0ABQ7KPG7_BRACM|nr:hypothetical protein IGI04_040433 [Brassica rapa subsp. trilocularis]
MHHLKKMVKNQSRVERSIVAQVINEETAIFAENYFPPEVHTKHRRPARHDDRGKRARYHVTVPSMFKEIGRLSGKFTKRRLTDTEHAHLQTYLLTNCEDVLQYESVYMAELRMTHRHATEDELQQLRDNGFVVWLRSYVNDGLARGFVFDDWIREFVQGPNYVVKSYPKFCTRGYAFTRKGHSKTTYDAGVSSSSGDDVYYGNIKEILEIQFPGMVGLRCVVFYCDWYDTTPDRGVKIDVFGVTSVHSRRKLQYYDPFILGSQADQVCYISYPRVTYRDDPWVTVTQINPRGRVDGTSDDDEPLQPESTSNAQAVEDLANVELVEDLTEFGLDAVVHSEPEAEVGESEDVPRPAARLRRSSVSSSRASGSSHKQNSVIAYIPAPAPAAPTAAAQQDPGVMPVDLLHLPVLHPNPRRGHSTWFTKSKNGISRSINQMMYSMLRFGYSKWSVIPFEERELWFRQFADPVIKGVVDLVEAEIATQSQPLSDDGDSTGASTNLSLLQINEMVEKAVPKRKGGRLVGLARRASSYPASSSQAPYADPMILEELHDKDERIGALEEQNTTILSENATIRSENATILAELASQKKFNAEIMQKLDRLMSSSSYIRNRKKSKEDLISKFAYERLQQGIGLGSRAVGEIPSSSNPKTAKPN